MTTSELIMCDEYDTWNSNEGVAARKEASKLLKLKEQGLIIELPVPIGSIVYGIDSKNEISRFEISIHFPLGILRTLVSVWGKEVFATQEEAEKRLEELRT